MEGEREREGRRKLSKKAGRQVCRKERVIGKKHNKKRCEQKENERKSERN